MFNFSFNKSAVAKLFFVLAFFGTACIPASSVEAAPPPKPTSRLIIPSIKVSARIQTMGMTKTGAMAVPANNVDAAWYGIGTRPGDTGSAVIGGHNRWAKSAGVFVNLNKLKVGDTMSFVDAKGVSTAFVVREMHMYNPLDDGVAIFNSDSGIHLNLITCAGVWNPKTQGYSKRLVIFTDMVTPLVT